MSIKKPSQDGESLEVTEKLGKTIKRLRNGYNYSLGDLSEQSGVATSIISHIEKN
jgi:predicted transcriptional regulator